MEQTFVWNVGTCGLMIREKYKPRTRKYESTDAGHRGGASRSSDENSVMELERKGRIDQLARNMKDLLTIIETLESKGACFEIMDQNINTCTASGKAFLQMFGVFAEFETNIRRKDKWPADQPHTEQYYDDILPFLSAEIKRCCEWKDDLGFG